MAAAAVVVRASAANNTLSSRLVPPRKNDTERVDTCGYRAVCPTASSIGLRLQRRPASDTPAVPPAEGVGLYRVERGVGLSGLLSGRSIRSPRPTWCRSEGRLRARPARARTRHGRAGVSGSTARRGAGKPVRVDHVRPCAATFGAGVGARLADALLKRPLGGPIRCAHNSRRQVSAPRRPTAFALDLVGGRATDEQLSSAQPAWRRNRPPTASFVSFLSAILPVHRASCGVYSNTCSIAAVTWRRWMTTHCRSCCGRRRRR